MIETIPLPTTDDPVDAPFWQGCREGRLLIQHCGDCGQVLHPPRAMCPSCQSMRMDWKAASGTGRIWSFAVPQPPLLPAFAALAPYVTAVVTPDDHPDLRIVGAMTTADGKAIGGVAPDSVHVGASVHVRFVPVTDDVVLPCWTLDTPSHSSDEDDSQ